MIILATIAAIIILKNQTVDNWSSLIAADFINARIRTTNKKQKQKKTKNKKKRGRLSLMKGCGLKIKLKNRPSRFKALLHRVCNFKR